MPVPLLAQDGLEVGDGEAGEGLVAVGALGEGCAVVGGGEGDRRGVAALGRRGDPDRGPGQPLQDGLPDPLYGPVGHLHPHGRAGRGRAQDLPAFPIGPRGHREDGGGEDLAGGGGPDPVAGEQSREALLLRRPPEPGLEVAVPAAQA